MGLFRSIHGNSGFTLIELLISILLFGIVAGLLSATIVSSMNLHHRTIGQLDLHRSLRKAVDWLDADLANLDRRGSGGLACDSSSVIMRTNQAYTDTSGFRFLGSRMVFYGVLEKEEDGSFILQRWVPSPAGTVDTLRLRLPNGYRLHFEAYETKRSLMLDLPATIDPDIDMRPAGIRLIVSQSPASAPVIEVIFERSFIFSEIANEKEAW